MTKEIVFREILEDIDDNISATDSEQSVYRTLAEIVNEYELVEAVDIIRVGILAGQFWKPAPLPEDGDEEMPDDSYEDDYEETYGDDDE